VVNLGNIEESKPLLMSFTGCAIMLPADIDPILALLLYAKRKAAANVCPSIATMNDQPIPAASNAAPSTAPSRKVFKVAVDDSTLINGLKKTTRDGIRKWVNQGAIQLFIPLHSKFISLYCTVMHFTHNTIALDRLGNLAKRHDRISAEAREALRWLDEITSVNDNVHLQGGFEVYENWSEVEKYMLPDTVLTQNDEPEETDNLTGTLADLHVDDSSDRASVSSHDSVERSKTPSSPLSSYSSTSPGLRNVNPYVPAKVLAPIGTGRPMHKKSDSNASSSTQGTTKPEEKRIPFAVRPFFNHIVWRINQEQTESAMESWIVLTNDPLKQSIAQRFGIRAKRLEQLRDIITHEDRDLRNRQILQKKEAEAADEQPNSLFTATTLAPQIKIQREDEDEVVVKRTRSPPKGPRAAMIQSTNGFRGPVWDPNAFGPAGHIPNGRNTFPRGNRTMHRGRGGRPFPVFPHKGPAPMPRQQQNAAPFDPSKPIDPDSYNRPPPSRSVARGGRRTLWEPS
jgi:hypothetical protein